ncbi:hypothetical protein ACFLQO_01460, partial [Candidatus Aenigmatarchaeota archaeon]
DNEIGTEEKIKAHQDGGKKPIIRIKLTGKEKELPLENIKTMFQDRALVSFKKATDDEHIQAKTIEEHKLSVQELGKKLLEDNLREAKLDPRIFEDVFELILENKSDEVIELLRKE